MSKAPRAKFFTTTVIGGLLFLVPVVFLVFILGKAFGFMLVVAKPMADFLPVDTIGGVALANLIALLGIVLVCFLAGLVARNALASDMVRKLESNVLMKMPGYALIRGIKGGYEEDSGVKLKPVSLTLGSAERIGFEVQRLPDGRSMVFIPSVPNTWSGITQILPPDQVTYLDVAVTSVVELVERYGFGAEELLSRKVGGTPAADAATESGDEAFDR